MSKGKAIYQHLCDAPNVETAVRSLDPPALTEVYGYLARNYEENGISGAVFGVVLVESAARLHAAKPKSKGGKKG